MLEINPPLVILTAIVFLALIAILNPLLYKPMLKFIDDRNESIKNDEESASKNISDLGAYEIEIQTILSNARAQANKIRQDAITTARHLAQDELTSRKNALEAEYEDFLHSLNSQKDELKIALGSKVPELKSILDNKLLRI